jgi:serine/threonine protein kinase
MTGGAGTPRYMAPEVARMERSYGFPADVYSFTILLWQIITDRVPYASIASGVEFAAKVVNGNVRPNLKYVDSDLLKKLLFAGWASDPERRPTFSLIVKVLQKEIEMNPSFCKLSGKRGITKARRRSTMYPGSLIRAFKQLGQSDVVDERKIGACLVAESSRITLSESSSDMPPSKLDLLRRRKNTMAKAGLTLVAQTSQRSLAESLSREAKEDRKLLNDSRFSVWPFSRFTRAVQKESLSKGESLVCK